MLFKKNRNNRSTLTVQILYMMFITVLVFYIVWFVLTVLNQGEVAWMKKLVQKIDVCSLLPIWTFFAPNPGVSDYHLLYRVQDKDGTLSPFKTIDLINKKGLLNAVWNPDKRSQKALSDFVQEIKNLIFTVDDIEAKPYVLKLSFSYIAILNYCTEINRQVNEIKSVQFMILESFGYFEHAEPALILNSEFHHV